MYKFTILFASQAKIDFVTGEAFELAEQMEKWISNRSNSNAFSKSFPIASLDAGSTKIFIVLDEVAAFYYEPVK
jgi:hypothetical protein